MQDNPFTLLSTPLSRQRQNSEPLRLVPFPQISQEHLAVLLDLYRATFEAPWEMSVTEVGMLAHPSNEGAGLQGSPVGKQGMALLSNDLPVGMAIAQYLPGANLWHLQYMAVVETHRGRGLGSWLLKAMAALGEETARRAGHEGCCATLLEVEAVDSPPATADRALRRRRIAFYQRHGAVMAGMRFARPPWAPAVMPDWEIMLLPGSAWAMKPGPPTRRSILYALMVEGYGTDPDAPWLSPYLQDTSDIPIEL